MYLLRVDVFVKWLPEIKTLHSIKAVYVINQQIISNFLSINCSYPFLFLMKTGGKSLQITATVSLKENLKIVLISTVMKLFLKKI